MHDHTTTDEPDGDSRKHTLTLDEAKGLLSGASRREMEDASWVWSRPQDEGQYVALAEGDWVELYLTHDGEGKLVLSGHHDSTGAASFEGEDAKALKRWALASSPRWEQQMATYDPAAVRRIVEDATAGHAREIAHACNWTDGKPSAIDVAERLVSVGYAGALPQAVAGPLRDNIVDDLLAEGFDYRDGRVRILPVEGVDD